MLINEVTHIGYCCRLADSYPRTCPECKCSLDDGHYDPRHDICSIAEKFRDDYRRNEMAEWFWNDTEAK